jgi:hypothetical protein
MRVVYPLALSVWAIFHNSTIYFSLPQANDALKELHSTRVCLSVRTTLHLATSRVNLVLQVICSFNLYVA